MAGYIRFHPQGSEFSSLLVFDVVESEEVTFDADVTEHPVERGADLTDHKRLKPVGIRLTADLANTPTTPLAAVFHPEMEPPQFVPMESHEVQRPGDDGRSALERIHESCETVEVFLGLEDQGRLYESMMIQSLVFSRDGKTGDVVRFNATLREVRVAESELVSVKRVKVARAEGKVERGLQGKKEASDADAAAAGTVAHNLFGDLVTRAFNPGAP